MRKSAPTPAQVRWQNSEELHARLREVGARNRAALARAPRCGAKRKRDGEPCQQPGVGAGGRCRFHGGASKSGAQWHVLQPVRGPTPSRTVIRLNKKLAKLEKERRQREKMLATATPEKRQKYEAWLASHQPGDPRKRASRREEVRRNQELREDLERLADRPEPAPSAALQAIYDRIAACEAELAEAERLDDEMHFPTRDKEGSA